MRWSGLSRALLACVLSCGMALPASAVRLEATVSGQGAPLEGAVISLTGAHPSSANAGARATIDQRGSQFVPHVLAVQAGTSVTFPNSDQIQHQMYSFSAPRRFELPLYAGTQASPIRFEQPGIVVLGCNIHDWMIGYVVVVDTPYFAKSDANGALSIDAPPGKYRLRAWHERLGGAPYEQDLTLAAGKPVALALPLNVAAAAPARPGNDRLKALQEKFRRIKPAP